MVAEPAKMVDSPTLVVMVLPPVVMVVNRVSVEIGVREPAPPDPEPPDPEPPAPLEAATAEVAAREGTELPALDAEEEAKKSQQNFTASKDQINSPEAQKFVAYAVIELMSVPAGQDWVEQSRTPKPKLSLLHRQTLSPAEQPRDSASASMLLKQVC